MNPSLTYQHPAEPSQLHPVLLRVLITVVFLFAGFFITFFTTPATAAQAATTSCGQAVCSVSTTARGVSNWDSVYRNDYRNHHGNVAVPNPNIRTYRVPCSYWLPTGGGTTTRDYPADRSGSHTCHFYDGAALGGGSYGIFFQCHPRPDRAANGRVDYYVRLTDGSLYYSHYRCLYPTDSYAPIERMTGKGKVYTGGRGDFHLTDRLNSTRHGASGARTDTTGYINRGVDLRYPERYTGEWKPSFDAETGVDAQGNPSYGFYRLDWELHYRMCERWEYPGWLNEPARIDCSQRGTDRPTSPYTYGCDSTPALQAGVRASAIFDPARCVSSWECEISDHTRVGGSYGDVFVLRNGQESVVAWNARAVSDPANRVRVNTWQHYSTVADGATPRNPSLPPSTDAHREQFFQTSWDWERWENIDGTDELFFYWASDPGAPFSWDTEYRFRGEFYVPTQASLGSGSRSGWVDGTGSCASTYGSPDVTVLRSVNTLPDP